MITIVVPIFNVEKYLQRCLESIQLQTYTDFEVMMVDDGSTDGSSDIARAYSMRDKRFRYIYQTNNGQGSARNNGIRMANGDYLCFVDSDDYVHSQYLELLHKTVQENDAQIASCGVERVFENGRIVDYKITNQHGASVIKDIEKYLLTASFSVWNKIFRKELFENLEFPERIKFEDFALMPRVYERAKCIASITDKLYYYSYRSNSTTTGTKINLDILKAQKILEDSDFGQRHPEITKIYCIRQVFGTLLWAMSQETKYKDDVKRISQDAKRRYPDINNFIGDNYIGRGKMYWGRLILNEQYYLAHIYASAYEKLRFYGKVIRGIIKNK